MIKIKKAFLSANIALICAVCVLNYFYITEGGLFLKGLCSSVFALMGIVNLVYAIKSGKKHFAFNISMTVGLVLAMLGDIFLEIEFILGAALFAAGHICYFAAHCCLIKFSKLDLIISAVLFAGSGAFLLLYPELRFDDSVMKWVCFAYALIISFMTGKAISGFLRKPKTVTAILAIGSVLFFFSDLMLVLDMFVGTWSLAGTLCLATYYPAECFLGLSAFYANTEKAIQLKKA